MIALIKRVLGVKPDARETSLVWFSGMRFAKGDDVKMQDGRWIKLQPTMVGMTIARASIESGRVRRNGSVIRIK